MADTVTLHVLNGRTRDFLRDMLQGLSDEQVGYSAPAIDERSIAGVTVHAYGCVLIFANFVLGKGGSWSDIPLAPTTAADLLAFIDRTHQQFEEVLATLPEGVLEQKHKMTWGQEITGIEAFVGALAHTLAHAGAIQGIRYAQAAVFRRHQKAIDAFFKRPKDLPPIPTFFQEVGMASGLVRLERSARLCHITRI